MNTKSTNFWANIVALAALVSVFLLFAYLVGLEFKDDRNEDLKCTCGSSHTFDPELARIRGRNNFQNILRF